MNTEAGTKNGLSFGCNNIDEIEWSNVKPIKPDVL